MAFGAAAKIAEQESMKTMIKGRGDFLYLLGSNLIMPGAKQKRHSCMQVNVILSTQCSKSNTIHFYSLVNFLLY